jgi:hypothetical protein
MQSLSGDRKVALLAFALITIDLHLSALDRTNDMRSAASKFQHAACVCEVAISPLRF